MVRLTQVVDKALITSLQKRLTDELEMSVVFEEAIDGDMKTIGERGKICESCTLFIDVPKRGQDKCIWHDSKAAKRAMGRVYRESGEEVIVEFYVCNGQMRNFAIPVSIGGDVLGCVYAGQFLVDKQKDKDFETQVKKMMGFGWIQSETIEYATPPSKKGIPKIARDNNIFNKGEFKKFEKVYTKNLNPDIYKSLEEVIEAVYLLNEIAKTISVLGTAYYLKNLYVRIRKILPKSIEINYKNDVDKLSTLIHEIDLKQTSDFPTLTKQINEISYNLLQAVDKYETDYIKNLLIPYSQGLVKNESTKKIEFEFKLEKSRYELESIDLLSRIC